ILGMGPGIGLATARRFGREGFALALVARTEAEAQGFRATLEGEGCRVRCAWGADLGDEKAVETLKPELADLSPQALLYNASGGVDGLPSTLSRAALDASLQLNLHAPLICVQALLPRLRRSTLLFTGGGLALEPKATQSALSLGKSSLRTLALCLAEELEPLGHHVATVTVAGWVRPDTAFSPEAVAEVCWELHQESPAQWRREVVMKP
ncbi:MAG: SDR family NAD(P)-dependent oxidoreductase, partial [Firmicutes bacterium]|nr:SDR family NAD(P)-dependent oxidoreductase [Bacillota bacterium]